MEGWSMCSVHRLIRPPGHVLHKREALYILTHKQRFNVQGIHVTYLPHFLIVIELMGFMEGGAGAQVIGPI